MKKSIQSAFLVFVLLAVLLNGCAPTPTPYVPTSPESVSEPPHEIYAGFTDNQAMPFIMIHQNGESLVMTQDVNSSNVTGGVWNSTDGQSVVIYSDSDGRPTSAVIGDDVILYSNYTNDTVDVTVIQADGTSTTYQATLDTETLNKIMSFVPFSDQSVSYSLTNLHRQGQSDMWYWMKNGMFMMDITFCAAGTVAVIATGTVALPLLMLAGFCTGALLETLTRAGTFLNIDVGGLESANDTSAVIGCGEAVSKTAVNPIDILDLKSCVDLLIPIAEEQEKSANLIMSNGFGA